MGSRFFHAELLGKAQPQHPQSGCKRKVQEPLLSKWGFDPSEEGLAEMMVCLSDHTFKDPALRQLADETTKMLYGGEDGMWGMEDA
eukprot:symbB.v1.2.019136.t1/scaffold1556.1/size111904/4